MWMYFIHTYVGVYTSFSMQSVSSQIQAQYAKKVWVTLAALVTLATEHAMLLLGAHCLPIFCVELCQPAC